MSISAALKAEVNEIDMALNKIAMGTYGTCGKCGMEISEEVLEVAPESEFCAACKKQAK